MKKIDQFIQEKLRINKETKLEQRDPNTKSEEACKELADICKKTLFNGIELEDKAFIEDKDTKNMFVINNPKYFVNDDEVADEFYKKRSAILKAAISCGESKLSKSICLCGLKLETQPYVKVSLNNNKTIDYILISKYIKEWLV